MVALTARQARERYRLREKEADDFGRIITVRLLHPSEQTEIVGMTPHLSGFEMVPRPDGTRFDLSHRAPLLLAAAVCEIHEEGQQKIIAFPRSYNELRSIFDELDAEGLAAAGRALVRLSVKAAPAVEPLEEAKNLSGTLASDAPVG
jgi:hypothetical protein